MDITLAIIGLIMGIVGLLGVIIPVLPGTILSYIGLLAVYFIGDGSISTLQLVICGIISVVVVVLDYILPGYFSKMFGGSKAGVVGATIGVLVGMFMGPTGIILGPFVGAVAGEMLNQRLTFGDALKVGFGSLVSFIVGSGMKLIITGMMMYYIWKDLFLQIKEMF